MTITDHPLHRSGRAVLPYPALASGNDAPAAERIGMAYGDWRQVAFNQPFHSFPEDPPLLATAAQYWAYAYPCQRFGCVLVDASGAVVVRYTFSV